VVAVRGKFHTMLPDTVLTLVKQQLKSINCTPTARTPIDHVAWDLLHWHLRVLNDLIKLADAAAKQLPGVHTGLLASAAGPQTTAC
jgi:hypothetical protein